MLLLGLNCLKCGTIRCVGTTEKLKLFKFGTQ